jgi:benzylsuccinate CoA-transferase BbsF subunit
MSRLPLEGLRVTDFCWVGAGSYTTKLLADMGAEVLKIESSTRLDALRLSGPFKDKISGVNRSGYFADRNTSKLSVTINLKTPKGIELVRKLIDRSDIVTNNFTPGTMERLGLGYEELSRADPGLIYVGMSFQGSDGPERDTLGFGLTMGALIGLHYLTGLPGRPPAGTGTNYPDHIPNPCHAAFAILAALRFRRRTGIGQKIDIAQIEPPLALLAPAMMDYAVNGNDPGPSGNGNLSAAPRGVYPCRGEDRWIAISVQDDAQYHALVDCLAAPEISEIERWNSLAARHREKDAMDKAIASATARWDGEELMALLQRRGVPAGIVNTAADVVARDPQLTHREHWRRMPHAETDTMLYNAQPFRFASTPIGPRFGAPLLGEHTDAVCERLLDLDAAAIRDLRSEGVLS